MNTTPNFEDAGNLPVHFETFHLEGFPEGFALHPDGIWKTSEDQAAVRICGPIVVVACGRTEDGADWRKIVIFTDRDGNEKEMLFPVSDFDSAERKVLPRLQDAGLWVAHGANKMIAALLQQWDVSDHVTIYDRHGWLGSDFETYAFGDSTHLGSEDRRSTAPVDPSVRRSGTLDGWRREVAGRCIGNPLAVLAVSHAFAGPLLRVLGIGGGGFHFFGASSCGKSTLLQLASSVWGGVNFRRSWHATSNAFEPVARLRNDNLLPLDEIGEADPKGVGKTAYLLANGQPKARMDIDGDERRQSGWRIAVLSNGEVSLARFLGEAGQKVKAGMNVRLVDVRADNRTYGAFDTLRGSPDGGTFVNALQACCDAHHGHAGPAFVRWLIEKDAWERVKGVFSWLRDECHAALGPNRNPQTERVADRFAVAALAGELATEAGLTGWNTGDAMSACMVIVVAWHSSRTVAEPDELEDILVKLRPCLEEPESTGLNKTGSGEHGAKGWYDDEFVYLLPETLRSKCSSDPTRVAGLLRDAGLLRCQDGLQYRVPRSTHLDRPRVYAIAREESSPAG